MTDFLQKKNLYFRWGSDSMMFRKRYPSHNIFNALSLDCGVCTSFGSVHSFTWSRKQFKKTIFFFQPLKIEYTGYKWNDVASKWNSLGTKDPTVSQEICLDQISPNSSLACWYEAGWIQFFMSLSPTEFWACANSTFFLVWDDRNIDIWCCSSSAQRFEVEKKILLCRLRYNRWLLELLLVWLKVLKGFGS